jgi:hypothetical protein
MDDQQEERIKKWQERFSKWRPELWVDMASQLINETERGCALVSAALMEMLVRELLCAKCRQLSDISDKELNKIFKGFESQFSNFASCIRLARAMGLIGELDKNLLLEFAIWRNNFAHNFLIGPINHEGIKGFVGPVKDDIEGIVDNAVQQCQGDEISRDHLYVVAWTARMSIVLKAAIFAAENDLTQ